MEVLKPCSLVTCPMRASTCKYILDFNPKYDKTRTQWDKDRADAMRQVPGQRMQAVTVIDAKYLAMLEPILQADIEAGIVKCKADREVPINGSMSLDQIAEAFGITRPRVQQIQRRAEKKILEVKRQFSDFMVKSEE